MERTFGWSRWWKMLIPTAWMVVAIAGVAGAEGGNVVWESREGYVSIVPQDTGENGTVAPNNQPVELTEATLSGLLGSIQERDTLKDKPAPLFTEGALQLLVPHLRQALSQAGPREDVSFTVVGLYKSLYGLANKSMVTAGRLFYRDGKLNIIFGTVKEEVRYRQDTTDRDFRQIATGSRRTAAQGDWSLVPGAEHPLELPRRDWVVLDTRVPITPSAVAGAAVVTAVGKKATKPLPERLATLNELKDKGLITADEYTAKRAEIMSEQEPERTPAERLTTLNELKSRGLITPEEYRAKRIQIMNDL